MCFISHQYLIITPVREYHVVMKSIDLIKQADPTKLSVLKYPDPRLRTPCLDIEVIDENLRTLVDAMQNLMFATNGVGLAAPQVGVTIRMFIASPTFNPEDSRVYINPQIIESLGTQEDEEGCLSLPGIFAQIKRSRIITIEATDLDGNIFRETGEDLAARVFQHETDHLDGKLMLDRMGSVSKLASRKTLKKLELEFSEQ